MMVTMDARGAGTPCTAMPSSSSCPFIVKSSSKELADGPFAAAAAFSLPCSITLPIDTN